MKGVKYGEAAVTLEPSEHEARRQERLGRAFPILLLTYLIDWGCTRAHFMADTSVYAQAILRHDHGGESLDHSFTTNPFWDFGHILWRPLGWLGFTMLKPVVQFLAHQNQQAEVILTLIGINFLAALGCVIVFYLLVRRIIGCQWPALLATIGFFSADAFLNYAHTGNAYVVGLTCLVAGMYVSFSEDMPGASLGRASVAALMFALAVLFWFPYIFVVPAAVAAPLLLQGHDKPRLRLSGQTLAVCAVIGVTVYAVVATSGAGIRDLAGLRDWVMTAGHGQIQPGGLRAAARMAFAVPRSLVNMDRDGMWLKRYLVHDPYAPPPGGLFRLGLWKLVLFYASVGTVCAELFRHKRGRMLLLLLAGAVLPIFFFAIFIFEAGSLERYLPLYPFVFLAFGYVLGNDQTNRMSKILLFVSLVAMVAVNINAMRPGTLDSEKLGAKRRIQDLVPLLKPNDTVMAINGQDNLAEFRQNFPLDALNLEHEWQTYDVLEINADRLATWRKDFADRVLTSWQRGGVVWLPQRFFHDNPKPEWNWVEGDDKRVKWTDLPLFFSQFELGPPIGGEDGFVPLLDTPTNKAILNPLSSSLAKAGVQSEFSRRFFF